MTLDEYISLKDLSRPTVGAVRGDSYDEPDYISDIGKELWPSIHIDEIICDNAPRWLVYSRSVEEEFREYWGGHILMQIEQLHHFFKTVGRYELQQRQHPTCSLGEVIKATCIAESPSSFADGLSSSKGSRCGGNKGRGSHLLHGRHKYLMRLREILQEAPVADIETFGNLDVDGSFNEKDRAYLRSALKRGLYVTKLSKVPFDLYVYIVNDAVLADLAKQFPEDEIKNWDANRLVGKDENGALKQALLGEVRERVLDNKRKNPKAVHFIMGDNEAVSKFRPTPWIVIHRLLHCVGQEIHDYYNESFPGVAKSYSMDHAILAACTFKSAQNPASVDPYEIPIEIATQYALTSNVPLDFDKMEEHLGEDAYAYDQDVIEKGMENFKDELRIIFRLMTGRTFYI